MRILPLSRKKSSKIFYIMCEILLAGIPDQKRQPLLAQDSANGLPIILKRGHFSRPIKKEGGRLGQILLNPSGKASLCLY
jgi:hypothetical protein